MQMYLVVVDLTQKCNKPIIQVKAMTFLMVYQMLIAVHLRINFKIISVGMVPVVQSCRWLARSRLEIYKSRQET